MASFVPLAAPFALVALVSACSAEDAPAGAGGSGGTSGAGTGGSGSSTQCEVVSGTFSITDDTNYRLPATVSVKTYQVKNATDLLFDWGALTQDFYGEPLDAQRDIDLVLISLWRKTPAELEEALSKDTLLPSENVGVITTYPMDSYTSRRLLEFDLMGNPVPPDELWQYFDTEHPRFNYPPDEYTFLLEASAGTVLGKGARMLAFFNLAEDGTDHLTLENDSADVDFTVHLSEARPVRVPAATPALTIDWSTMETNALGNEYDGIQITQAVVAHFSTQSLSDLENDFLNLEDLADGWWSGRVLSGKSIDLGTLKDASGAAFPGIDAEGVWLTALFCTTTCNNPAPWSITVLEPCE
jgi:hypothetical protein